MPKSSKMGFAKNTYISKGNLPGYGLAGYNEDSMKLEISQQAQFNQNQSRRAEQKVNKGQTQGPPQGPSQNNAGTAQKPNGY